MCVVNKYRRDGIVHFGRLAGTPDGVDVMIPLCAESISMPFKRPRGVWPVSIDPVDCMTCLVRKARRTI